MWRDIPIDSVSLATFAPSVESVTITFDPSYHGPSRRLELSVSDRHGNQVFVAKFRHKRHVNKTSYNWGGERTRRRGFVDPQGSPYTIALRAEVPDAGRMYRAYLHLREGSRGGVPALLRLQVFVGAELRANQPYTLIVDGAARGGVTDGDGVLQVEIPPRSQRAILEIGPDNHRFEIRLGHIDPITTLPGVQTRLHNLGFPCGSATDPADSDLHAALRAFQRFADLAETDDWRDPATRDALLRLHDSREWQPAEEGELEEILDEDDEDDEPPPVAAAPPGSRQT